MLFRHMFYCKHVERQLCSVWISNKAAKQCSLHSAKWCVSSAHTRSLLQKGNLSHTFVAYRSVTRFTLRSSATADRGGHWLCPSAVCADVGGRAR